MANSSQLSLPSKMAPSDHKLCVTVDSYVGIKFSSILLPAVVFTFFNTVNGHANHYGIDCVYEDYEIPDFQEYQRDCHKDNLNCYQLEQTNYIPILRKGE